MTAREASTVIGVTGAIVIAGWLLALLALPWCLPRPAKPPVPMPTFSPILAPKPAALRDDDQRLWEALQKEKP